MNNNAIKGTERERASHAYEKVLSVKKELKPDRAKEYKSYVKKAPMMIKTNGLAATLAFLFSKSDTNKEKSGYSYKLLLDHLDEWIRRDSKHLITIPQNRTLVGEILLQDSGKYRAVTVEILAYLNWLKRFADGLIEGE